MRVTIASATCAGTLVAQYTDIKPSEGNPIVPTVRVFQFKKYNISCDEYQISRRWATREAVARVGGELLEDTAVEIDPSVLGREIEGMTVRDFDPRRRADLQRQVTGYNPFGTTNAAGSFRVSSFDDQ